MNTTPPLTTAKLGSTRCVGCEKLFTKTPDMETVETVTEISDGWGTSPSGKMYRRLGRHKVTRLWHAACLTSFREQCEENARQADAHRQRDLDELRKAMGISA